MGVVYQGLDPHIERTVAIKTISTQLSCEDKDQEKWKTRFLREARLAGNLTHKNIATIYDVGNDSGLVYIAMEYIDGQSLREVINDTGKLSHDDIHTYMQQICDAMSYAHQQGVIHCDLKAENILIDKSGNIAIVDFGTARRFTPHNMTQIAALMATPSSSAPERINGDDLSPESDVFSIGVIFYEMVTGHKPFAGDDISTVIKKVLYDEPPRPTSIDDSLSPEIDSILDKALAKNPMDRYHSCEELMGDIVRNNVLSVPQSDVGTIVLDQRTVAMPYVAKKNKLRKKVCLSISILFLLMIVSSFCYYFLKYVPQNSTHRQNISANPMGQNPKHLVLKSILDPTGPLNKHTVESQEVKGLTTSDDSLGLGKQALQRHDNMSAIAYLEKARDEDPKNCEAHYLLGLAYHNNSLHNKSISEYNKAIHLEEAYAPPYRGLAEVYEARKEIQKAISYYEDYSKLLLSRKQIEEITQKINALQAQLLEKESRIQRAEALFRAGKEHYTEKRYEEAIRELEHCITVDPNHQECQKVLEMARTQKEKRRQKDIEACYAEGQGFLKNKDYLHATYSFNKVLKLSPDHADAKRQLKLAKESMKRRQEVEKYYAQGLQSIDSGKYSQAVALFEKVVCLDREFGKAWEYLETAKEKKKTIAEYFSSGVASFKKGEYGQAMLHFSNVLKLNPNNSDAKRYLEIAQLKKMEEKLEEKKLDIVVNAQGDAKLPEGW
jgi:serine/threonine protein kinase/tetratricopeptide (TPR) repeat protein